TSLGSSSEMVAAIVFTLFACLQGVSLFLMKKPVERFAQLASVVFAGVVVASILKLIFYGGMGESLLILTGASVALLWALHFIQKYVAEFKNEVYALGGIVLLGLVVLFLTPIGEKVKSAAAGAVGVAQFNNPLSKTIAEQGVSGAVFEPNLGFIGLVLNNGVYGIIGIVTWIPSAVVNLVFQLFTTVINLFLGTKLEYAALDPRADFISNLFDVFGAKENSMLLALLFSFLVASCLSAYRMFVKKEDTPLWFFIALVLPISLIGLIKMKFVIYLGYVVAMSTAFTFGEISIALSSLLNNNKWPLHLLLVIILGGMAFVQFFGAPNSSGSIAPAIMQSGFSTRFQDNPAALQVKFTEMCEDIKLAGSYDADVCEAGTDSVAYAEKGINYQYNSKLCYLSLINDVFNATDSERLGASLRCERVSSYWIESMEWVRDNTDTDSRITSWWDYGHWENFFGQRNAVIRNEHVSTYMIGNIAHDYLMGTPEELKQDMGKYDSEYALFDSELLYSGNTFGGKYGALNYLGCAFDNETGVDKGPGQSVCEMEHLWTQVLVPVSVSPAEECSISYTQKGVIGYSNVWINGTQKEKKFCINPQTLEMYDMDERMLDGTLKMHKAEIQPVGTTSMQGRDFYLLNLVYTKEMKWVDNGELKSGWEDRTSKFYDSNLYNAFVLENLPGFELVYKTSDGQVKIFKRV
ncbi:hypothetical protein KJ780_03435, partial [Candidatus Micrarchaeota archaeon]|nr:hypothetical protein [Candidatus Micrarchaeota archaeon]